MKLAMTLPRIPLPTLPRLSWSPRGAMATTRWSADALSGADRPSADAWMSWTVGARGAPGRIGFNAPEPLTCSPPFPIAHTFAICPGMTSAV